MTAFIHKKFRRFFITVATVVAAISTPWSAAWAQSEEQVAQSEERVLEEVIVTAQKREQSAQDVPSTVNSALGETLREFNVFDFADIEKMTPGLDTRQVAGRAGSVSLRGVTYNPNSGASQAVDVYFNDTTTGVLGSGGVFQQVFDIDRIEVLRGPQGTLQGRTSPGGTINIHTAKPDLDEVTGYLRTTFTDNSGNNTQFAASMPLIEGSLAIRFAGVYDESDLNEAVNILDGKTSNSDSLGGRFSVSWLPTDTLSIDFAYQHLENDLSIVTTLLGSSTLPFQPVPLPDIGKNEFKGIQLQPLLNDGEYTDASLEVQWDIWDNHQLNYVSGYHKVTSLNSSDTANGNSQPGTPAPGFAAPQVINDTDKASSHELRLSSMGNEFWDYTVGLYYGDESGESYREQLQSKFAIPVFIPTPFDFQDIGVFNENVFNLTDQWTAQLGVRWQTTDRKIKSGVFSQVDIPQLGISEGDQLALLIPNGIGNFDGDKVTGSASISYAFDDPEVMIYAKTATSYRPGGATVTTVDLGDLATYDEENSWFVEFGAKTTLADGRIRLNGSVFYQDFDSYITRLNRISVNRSGNAAAPTVSSITTNGDVEILGLEIFGDALLTDNWVVSANATFIDSSYKSGVMLPCNDGNPIPDGTVANLCNVGGDALGVQPAVSFTVTSDYTIPLETSELYVRALLNYIGKREDTAAPNPDKKLGSYGTFDMYLGWRLGQGQWDISVFANNLFDENAINNYTPEWRTRVGSLGTGYFGAEHIRPRLYGLSVTYNY